MSDYVCFFILVLSVREDDYSVLKCALKIPLSLLDGDCVEYPMEPENIAQIAQFLPEHLAGIILSVETIFDVVVV